MNILLGLTGSVATTLAPKIIAALEAIPNCDEVRVVMTEKSQMFQEVNKLRRASKVKIYTDNDEWQWAEQSSTSIDTPPGVTETTYESVRSIYQKGDPILHIDLARWASIIVIAPCTANTIYKLANGQADNLLTCIMAARNKYTPVIIAPSMNPEMWTSHPNKRNLTELRWNDIVNIVPPSTKKLACGETGVGALADITTITQAVEKLTRWHFPLPFNICPGIPINTHPGAFGAMRKHDRHCGVDLYCPEGTPVLAVEDGDIIIVEDFTGTKAGCPWWLDTMAVKVAGPSGTICYGEIIPDPTSITGSKVHKGQRLGVTTPVLRPGKERPDIPGHSRSMLHLQMYTRGTTYRDDNWTQEGKLPDNILDPTNLLLDSMNCSLVTLDMPSYTVNP
jgi:phosphopantothenoylcysteine decarboxylase